MFRWVYYSKAKQLINSTAIFILLYFAIFCYIFDY
nr:MAG TPA: hypothetical protein [Caudoviricetes sp.]